MVRPTCLLAPFPSPKTLLFKLASGNFTKWENLLPVIQFGLNARISFRHTLMFGRKLNALTDYTRTTSYLLSEDEQCSSTTANVHTRSKMQLKSSVASKHLKLIKTPVAGPSYEVEKNPFTQRGWVTKGCMVKWKGYSNKENT